MCQEIWKASSCKSGPEIRMYLYLARQYPLLHSIIHLCIVCGAVPLSTNWTAVALVLRNKTFWHKRINWICVFSTFKNLHDCPSTYSNSITSIFCFKFFSTTLAGSHHMTTQPHSTLSGSILHRQGIHVDTDSANHLWIPCWMESHCWSAFPEQERENCHDKFAAAGVKHDRVVGHICKCEQSCTLFPEQ